VIPAQKGLPRFPLHFGSERWLVDAIDENINQGKGMIRRGHVDVKRLWRAIRAFPHQAGTWLAGAKAGGGLMQFCLGAELPWRFQVRRIAP